MRTKTAKKTGASARYTPEDLAPRDGAADEAAMEEYLKRNKNALNASIEKAQGELERGETFTHDQVMADIGAQKRRRARGR